MMKINNVSIIIPVYNGEKYIKRCLDSICSQTFQDLETIIVNDGSTDNSLELINNYTDKIPNLVIINKENAGSWKARIDGIKASNSEYITFMDVDDEIEPNFVEELYNTITANNADISVCGYYRIDSETNKICSKEMTGFGNSVIDLQKDIKKIALINTSNWNKMYKKELFNQAINYSVDSISFEDLTLNVFAYSNANTIAFNNSYLYKYYVNSKSLMNSISIEHIENLKKTFLNLKDEILKKNEYMLSLIDFMAVMHLGFSINQRIFNSKIDNRKKHINDLCRFVKDNFPLWKKFKTSSVKLKIMRFIFAFNLVYPFLKIYTFMINKLKVDVKW